MQCSTTHYACILQFEKRKMKETSIYRQDEEFIYHMAITIMKISLNHMFHNVTVIDDYLESFRWGRVGMVGMTQGENSSWI